MVNNDPARVVRFNPADPEIVNRLLNMQKDFKNYKISNDIELNPDGSPKGDLEKGAAYIGEFSRAMRKAINDVFNADVYDILFNGQSPLCIVGPRGNEQYLFEGVVDALTEVMQPAIDEYNKKAKKRMNKYLGDLK